MGLESLLFALSTSLSTNLHAPGTPTHQSGLGLDLGVSRSLGDSGLTLGGGIGFSQGLSAADEASVTRSDFSMRWSGIELGGSRSRFSSALTLLLPFSNGRMGWESYFGGAKLAGVLSVPGAGFSVPWLDLSLSSSVAKHFHEYTTSVDGSSNSSASIATVAGASASLGRGFVFSTQGSWALGITYGGGLRERWGLDQDLSWSPGTRWSLSIGHSNSGAVFKANGRDLNIAVFDPETSVVYLSAGVSF
jgi:hypothetical protein